MQTVGVSGRPTVKDVGEGKRFKTLGSTRFEISCRVCACEMNGTYGWIRNDLLLSGEESPGVRIGCIRVSRPASPHPSMYACRKIRRQRVYKRPVVNPLKDRTR